MHREPKILEISELKNFNNFTFFGTFLLICFKGYGGISIWFWAPEWILTKPNPKGHP